MPTIKDIAQLAGVSQGTVSNVLNGKGNVSSKKIVLVEEAAKKLGYIVNERAKILRKGQVETFAVIIPKIDDLQYMDFFLSFKAHSLKYGYDVELYISMDTPAIEKKLIGKMKSSMVTGAVVFTSLGTEAKTIYRAQGFKENEILFAERAGGTDNYIGFDYVQAALDIAVRLKEQNKKKIILICDSYGSHEDLFEKTFKSCFKNNEVLDCIITVKHSRKLQIINAFDRYIPEAVVCTNIELAKICFDIKEIFFPEIECAIECLSPLFTLPEYNFHKYELNFHLLGHKASERLKESIQSKLSASTILSNTGYRNWSDTFHIRYNKPRTLHILLLDSPPAYAVQYFSRIYTRKTGIDIKADIVSYDNIHRIFDQMRDSCYDIVRIGADVLPWYGPKILKPIEEIDFDITSLFSSFISGMTEHYSRISGKYYAVPLSPSLQILFYRKDLFESTVLKRLYQEQHHEPLTVPRTFEQYNRIAAFFTKSKNPYSPVQFGSTITLGDTPVVAGTEFLTRYFSYSNALFKNDLPLLCSAEALQALKDVLILKDISTPPNVWWTDAAKEFVNGNVAMTILFSNFASGLWGPQSKIASNIDFAVIPGKNPLFGGGSLGVSRYTKYPEQALAFISWLCKEPVASGMALLGGNPLSTESLNNYDVFETCPWMELLKSCFSDVQCNRLPENADIAFNDRFFMTILGKAVKNAWFCIEEPQKALLTASIEYKQSVTKCIKN